MLNNKKLHNAKIEKEKMKANSTIEDMIRNNLKVVIEGMKVGNERYKEMLESQIRDIKLRFLHSEVSIDEKNESIDVSLSILASIINSLTFTYINVYTIGMNSLTEDVTEVFINNICKSLEDSKREFLKRKKN